MRHCGARVWFGLVLVAIVFSSAPLLADQGSLGMDDTHRLYLLAGLAGSNTSLGPSGVPALDGVSTRYPPLDLDGVGVLLGWRYGEYLGATRFQTLMGFEFGLSLGMLTSGASGANGLDPSFDAALGGLLFELETALNLGLLYWGGRDWWGGRLSAIAGCGFNLDFGYWLVGLRLVETIWAEVAFVELEALYLPLARSYGGNVVREARGRVSLIWHVARDLLVELGLHLRLGLNPRLLGADCESSGGCDDLDGSDRQRGRYYLTTGVVGLRWR